MKLQEKGYKYSAAGDILKITDTNDAQNITYTYGYDKLHRLITESNTGGSVTFNNALLRKTFDGNGPIHAVKSIKSAGVDYTFQYDANGNMTNGWDFTNPAQAASRTIAFNADNMPVQIQRTYGGSTTTVDFSYGGDGGRVKKAIVGGSTTYYIGSHFEVAAGTETKHIFAGNLRLAKVTTSTKLFYHKDHLGSSTVMTNYPAGLQSEGTEYLPFGLSRVQTGTEVTYYKFTDQELDAETGLYNYNARLYDPAIGIFISPDSHVQNPFDPQTFNRYTYCRNNPLTYTDPSGHLFVIDDIILGGLIGGVRAAVNGDNIWQGVLTGAAAGALGGIGGAVLQGAQIADPLIHAAVDIGSFAAVEKISKKVVNTTNDYLVQPTLYWVNAFNNVVIYPAFDLLALPDQLLGYATGTTFEERMAWSAQSPFPADDAVLGVVGVVGRLPKALRGVQKNAGRTGKQARLRELADDLKVSSADRGWIKNEMRHIETGNRKTIRLPGNSRNSKQGGKVLAHERGKRAKDGYGYVHSNLQDTYLHKLEHKYEGY